MNKILVLIHILVLGLSIASYGSEVDPYARAQKALAHGNMTEVEESLKLINKDHPQFKYVLSALIKIYFKNNQFDRFFGNMYFYKVNNLTEYTVSKETFMPELLALEALALNKLCRWKDALKVIVTTKNIAEKLGIEVPKEVAQAEIFIVSSLRVNGFSREVTKTLKDLGVMTKDGFWRLNDLQINKLDNPKNLRMNVRTMCKS